MKRISFLLITSSLWAAPIAHSQDAATEERLNKLSGQIEDLIAVQRDWKERLTALSKEIASVREQASKPSGNYAAQDDLKRLADTVKEVDRKRIEDSDRIRNELLKLGKVVTSTPPPPRRPASTTTTEGPTTDKGPPGFYYTIEKNDTLSLIVQAYREKKINVTTDQIIKANPGLDPKALRPGKKIFIPAPATTHVEN